MKCWEQKKKSLEIGAVEITFSWLNLSRSESFSNPKAVRSLR